MFNINLFDRILLSKYYVKFRENLPQVKNYTAFMCNSLIKSI